MQNSYLQGVLQDALPQVLEHTILRKGEVSDSAIGLCRFCYLCVWVLMEERPEHPGADLVSVSSTGLLRDIQTAAVLDEAAVGPVGVIKRE